MLCWRVGNLNWNISNNRRRYDIGCPTPAQSGSGLPHGQVIVGIVENEMFRYRLIVMNCEVWQLL